MLFVFDSIHDWYETQEKCESYFWKSFFDSILSWSCPDKYIYIYIYISKKVLMYISQRKCCEAVDDSLAALKLIYD